MYHVRITYRTVYSNPCRDGIPLGLGGRGGGTVVVSYCTVLYISGHTVKSKSFVVALSPRRPSPYLTLISSSGVPTYVNHFISHAGLLGAARAVRTLRRGCSMRGHQEPVPRLNGPHSRRRRCQSRRFLLKRPSAVFL